MKSLSIIFLLLLAFLFTGSAFGQDLRENDIREATNYFKEGRLDDVISILSSRNIESADKIMQAQAYKLLSSAYYEIDELEKGDTALVFFLSLQPLYQIDNANDPEVFIRALQRFKVSPKLNFNLKFGLNATNALVYQQNIISENVNYSNPYESKLGFNMYFGIERLLFYNFYFNLGIDVQSLGYKRVLDYENRPSTVIFELQDQMIRVGLPIGLSYKTNFRNFSVMAGGAGSLLYNRSVLTARYFGLDADRNQEKVFLSNNRFEYNARYYLIGRIGYIVGNIEYFVDFEHKADLLPAVNSEYMTELYYPMLYVDDEFYLGNNQLSIGFSIRLNYKVINRYE